MWLFISGIQCVLLCYCEYRDSNKEVIILVTMTPCLQPVTRSHMCIWSLVWAICLTLCNARTQEQLDATPLNDGLLVTPGESMRSHVATWTVIITLDRPAPEGELAQRLRQLTTLMRPLRNQTEYSDSTALWEGRITELERTLVHTQPSSGTRHRRAPLEFIGDIQSWLFGIPSHSEMTSLQRTIDDNRQTASTR